MLTCASFYADVQHSAITVLNRTHNRCEECEPAVTTLLRKSDGMHVCLLETTPLPNTGIVAFELRLPVFGFGGGPTLLLQPGTSADPSISNGPYTLLGTFKKREEDEEETKKKKRNSSPPPI